MRKNPLSRKFGLSKGKLGHICGTAGIRYPHMPDLGIDSAKRTSFDTQADYEALFDNYQKTLPEHTSQLSALYLELCSNTRIALMCFEKEPKMCHRHVIRDYLVNSYDVISEDL